MTDPKRWSEDEEAGELERELVLAGQAPRLPESEKRALWASIALGLPAAVPPPAPPGAPLTPSVGLGANVTKGLILLAAVGGLGFGAARLWPREEPGPAPTPRAQAQAPVATATSSQAAAMESRAPAATATPATPTNEAHRAATASQLRDESVAVLKARAALRAGDASQSLALLEQARARFPHGALGQEREALTIEALAKAGQTAAARRRAESFLRAHPQSPYVADVRRIAGQ